MKTARTFAERTTQLGRIAHLELELIKRDHKRNWRNRQMPRTNKAKRILWQYETNVFGRIATAEDICESGEFKTNWQSIKYTTAQFQGKK